MNKICALIPARYGSTRLEGKSLLKINNESIISRTYNQTLKSKYLNKDNVYVVTDDERIMNEIVMINGKVIIVKDECLNGTERICKALNKMNDNYEIIVNIQGDEPFIDPETIDFMIDKHFEYSYLNNNVVCTTVHSIIKDESHLYKSSFGKMVIDKFNNIIYCSRALIPSNKDNKIIKDYNYLTHIGIFVFKKWYLDEYIKHENTPLQLMEDIEWLKIIEMGYQIKSFLSPNEYEIGVNTIDDYNYLVNKYQK